VKSFGHETPESVRIRRKWSPKTHTGKHRTRKTGGLEGAYRTEFPRWYRDAKKRRVAVFVDSCFWHGCPEHCKMPVNNREFWEEKIVRNGSRDAEVAKWYEDNGWRIVRVWEHDLKDFLPRPSIKSNG
jgi:hypothetical protein